MPDMFCHAVLPPDYRAEVILSVKTRARRSTNFITTPSNVHPLDTTGWSSAPRLHRGGAKLPGAPEQCFSHYRCSAPQGCTRKVIGGVTFSGGTLGVSEERAGWPRCTRTHPEGRGAASVRLHGGAHTHAQRVHGHCTHSHACFFSLPSLSRFLFSLSVLCCVSHVPTLAFRVLFLPKCVVHVFSLALLLKGVLDRFLLCFCACSFGCLVLDVVVVLSQSPVPSNVSLRYTMCAQ